MFADKVPPFVGMVYAIVIIFAVFILLKRDKFTKKIRYTILTATSIIGFLIFSPMLPLQFQNILIMRNLPKNLLFLSIGGIFLMIILTYLFGRLFCGYACPIGTLQELMYKIPGRKWIVRNEKIIRIIHWTVLSAALILGIVFNISVLGYTGTAEIFKLNFTSPFFYVFAAILIISVFFYRPFCRLICPVGVFFSIASRFSKFNIRRDPQCSNCGLCEEACPTSSSSADSKKDECYACILCMDKCPTDKIDYSSKNSKSRGL